MLLKEKVALVTGAAQGIGLAIAEKLRANGAVVVLADRNSDQATEAADSLGDGAEAATCNVVDETSVEEVFDSLLRRHGHLDVLVNNAGITRDGMIHKLSLADFRAVAEVHLYGTWLCSRAAVTHMRSRPGGGAIVNMSSISGKIGNLGQTNYAAAKAGVVGMTKAIAREGARYGIRANAIQPGLIKTAMTQSMPDASWQEKLAGIPLGRAGEPSEVADAALFLACDLSSYITGTTIEVTGGRHM